jgi:4-amino-4-deoxy-L-arabinose transferase-like glycosyltransferase
VTIAQHGVRVGLLMALAAGLLGWLTSRTEVLFADGLRYVGHAQRIDAGGWRDGLLRSVDHPAYPLAIVAAHRAIGGDGPEDWQAAAQAASVLAGVLLVLPLYLVAVELFGARCAWLAVFLVYLTPVHPRVMADALSESTFLLFWTWGLWAALKFLRAGAFAWLPLMIAFGALAYWTRPEALLLPAALIATLATMPLLRSTRLNWSRWWAAVAFLVLGPALLIGPLITVKGGLGTKPGIARVLGTAPRSAADAVERARPLRSDQGVAETYLIATKEAFGAVRDAVSIPLLPLAVLGLAAGLAPATRPRVGLFLAIMLGASMLALIRLHATGGYCTPRHAMIPALVLIAAAASGLTMLHDAVRLPARWLGEAEGWLHPGPAVWVVVLAAFVAPALPEMVRPLNESFVGYRQAGAWLADHVEPDAKVVDLTGWSLFYGQRQGYTFRNFHEAAGNPDLRFVVVREAHLRGPWGYCERVRELVAGIEPVATFPPQPGKGQSRVFVFDRRPEPGAIAARGGDVAR